MVPIEFRVRDTKSFFTETGNLGTGEFVWAIGKIGLKKCKYEIPTEQKLGALNTKTHFLFA